jgi:formylmethanofuran dehydrogenase subunit E
MSREIAPDYFPEPEPRKVFEVCDICGNEIFEGDYYYHINGDDVCEDCFPQLSKELYGKWAE